MTNFVALDDAITYATENPDLFDMHEWLAVPFGDRNAVRMGLKSALSCGTTACLAGTAALQAGWVPHIDVYQENQLHFFYVRDADGRVRDVESVAGAILDVDGSSLFYLESIAEVIGRRNELAREEGVPEREWKVPAQLVEGLLEAFEEPVPEFVIVK